MSAFLKFCSSKDNADAFSDRNELVDRWRNLADKKKEKYIIKEMCLI